MQLKSNFCQLEILVQALAVWLTLTKINYLLILGYQLIFTMALTSNIRDKYKKKHRVVRNLLLYSLTAFTCCLFGIPIITLYSSLKVFVFVTLPKLTSIFLTSKSVFIVGNLIVILLIGESKIYSSYFCPTSHQVYDDDHINRSQGLQNSSYIGQESRKKSDEYVEGNAKVGCEDGEGNEEKEEEDHLDDKHIEEVTLPAEELSKRADDFIARVNRQRRLEARLVLCGYE